MSDPKRLSVIRNTSLNYLGQAYALLIGILILPFYLGHLGAEAYGLIGFFAVLQAWLHCPPVTRYFLADNHNRFSCATRWRELAASPHGGEPS